jgi:hypothetical protein
MPALVGLTATCFVIPTPRPESDGTFEWDNTTFVAADEAAGGLKLKRADAVRYAA